MEPNQEEYLQSILSPFGKKYMKYSEIWASWSRRNSVQEKQQVKNGELITVHVIQLSNLWNILQAQGINPLSHRNGWPFSQNKFKQSLKFD